MITDIANILKGKLIGLPFVDRIAGLTQIAIDKQPIGENKFKTIRFPIACNVTGKDCSDSNNRVTDLVPDSTKKSVFFFQDINGASFVNQTGNNLNFVADIRLVGWLNLKELGKDQCSITSLVVSNIIRAFRATGTFNEAPFTRVKINILKQVLRDAKIFSDYTFSETETQYLMYPYEHFALDLKVNFTINSECMNTFNQGIIDECNDT